MYRIPGLAFFLLRAQLEPPSRRRRLRRFADRVVDPSNAVIVDATVVAVNADTNTARQPSTDVVGQYVLTNLPPGPYRVEGFDVVDDGSLREEWR